MVSVTNGSVANDLDGNQTSLSGAGFAPLAVSYNTLGQLTQVSTGLPCTLGYDGFGRRVLKSPSFPGPARVFYIFDGDLLLGEVSLSGTTATVSAAYTWGAAGLVSERLPGSSKSLWYHFGPQGETRQLTNSSGTVVDTYVYTAYGVPLATTGSDANPFRYGGQVGYYTHADVGSGGLVLCGARWYQAVEGRWLTRDPIGYDGGPNLYEYCGSGPVDALDPDGLIDIRRPFGEWVRYRLQVGAEVVRELAAMADQSTWGVRLASQWLKGGSGPTFAQLADQHLPKARGPMGRLAQAEAWLGVQVATGAVCGGTGAGTKAPAVGLGALASPVSRRATEEGIYEVVTVSGRAYVGQSGNITRRLGEHVGRKVITPQAAAIAQRTEVLGGKLAREKAEQLVIDSHGGIRGGNLTNQVNPVGARRIGVMDPGYCRP